MNIPYISNQPTFTSRNSEIRHADKIMRNLMLQYPAFSSSRVKYYDIFEKQSALVSKKVLPIFWKLNTERKILSKHDGIKLIDATLKMVKKQKNANCAEFATMARAAFLANGYKDAKLSSLNVRYYKNDVNKNLVAIEQVDHTILIVNAGENAIFEQPNTFSKKVFIVDPWCGICDYLSNAVNTYRGIFLRDLTSSRKDTIQKFTFKEQSTMNITQETCNSISNKHPELVVK